MWWAARRGACMYVSKDDGREGGGSHSKHLRTKYKSALKEEVALPLDKHPLSLLGGIVQYSTRKGAYTTLRSQRQRTARP